MKNNQFKKLSKVCMADDFSDVYKGENIHVNGKGFTFVNNGANILAVAHWDTVQYGEMVEPEFLYADDNNKIVGLRSIQLDDRLGVFILMDILPLYGLKYDVLITDGEETGHSTAALFNPEDYKKDYNWIFEFDRRDILPVLYDYGTDLSWKTAVNSVQLTDYGSFSDISVMKGLKRCAVNWGAGYYGEHSDKCYCTESSISIVTSDFSIFYNLYSNRKFVYAPPPPKAYDGCKSAWGHNNSTTYNSYPPKSSEVKAGALVSTMDCIYCGETFTTDQMTHDKIFGWICKDCRDELKTAEYTTIFSENKMCDNCGLTFNENDLVFNSNKGIYMCPDCDHLDDILSSEM